MDTLGNLFADIFHLAQFAVGVAMLITEFRLIKYNGPSDSDSQADMNVLFYFGPFSYFAWRAPWYALSVFLIGSAFAASKHAQTPNDPHTMPPILLAALVLGIMRLAYVHFTLLYPNKHTEVVGLSRLSVVGARGILVKGVEGAATGTIRLEDAKYKQDEVDCIADDDIPAGTYVEVVEVDCDLLKVQKVTSHVHAPANQPVC